MAGKGDKRRPLKIGTEEFAERWDAIFNKEDDLTEDEMIEKMQMEAQTFRDSEDYDDE